VKVLDSDHCVAVLRGSLSLRDYAEPTEVLFITAISAAELTHGVYKSARPEENLARLEILLAELEVLPFDSTSARQFGILKAELEKSGGRLADLDLQIASIALSHRFSLVTHNLRHFSRIPDLQLEDWLN
jgi:tRNA(fMet)-specific endonuclease VapC